jgi:hypothetical protein
MLEHRRSRNCGAPARGSRLHLAASCMRLRAARRGRSVLHRLAGGHRARARRRRSSRGRDHALTGRAPTRSSPSSAGSRCPRGSCARLAIWPRAPWLPQRRRPCAVADAARAKGSPECGCTTRRCCRPRRTRARRGRWRALKQARVQWQCTGHQEMARSTGMSRRHCSCDGRRRHRDANPFAWSQATSGRAVALPDEPRSSTRAPVPRPGRRRARATSRSTPASPGPSASVTGLPPRPLLSRRTVTRARTTAVAAACGPDPRRSARAGSRGTSPSDRERVVAAAPRSPGGAEGGVLSRRFAHRCRSSRGIFAGCGAAPLLPARRPPPGLTICLGRLAADAQGVEARTMNCPDAAPRSRATRRSVSTARRLATIACPACFADVRGSLVLRALRRVAAR